jgi:AcrR family transcriptional regulator
MKKSAYHHGDLRAALLDNGLRLLALGGTPDKLSLREVARAAGVSATAVYHHFPDKNALLDALAEEGLERLAAAQHRASDLAGGGAAGFAATGRAYVAFALENPALFRLIFGARRSVLDDSEGEIPEAVEFLLSNAAALAPQGADQNAGQVIAIRSWAMAHGLSLLMLGGQVPFSQELIDQVLNPDTPGDEIGCP